MLATYKKVKNWQITRTKEKAPVLSQNDEDFLQRIVSEEKAIPSVQEPAAPSQIEQPAEFAPIDPSVAATATSPDVSKGVDKKANRFSFLQRVASKRKAHKDDGLDPDAAVEPVEAGKEEQDIAKVLESLNLSAKNNRAFSLSPASQEIVQKFTLVLKDLVNGVPTAYDDLVHLLDNSQEQLQKTFGSLPPFLQKLVQSLPTKLTGSLAPELLATAAETQGISTAEAGGAGIAGLAAKAASKIPSLKDIVTKPGAVIGLLKTIMNTLKLRWPAFLGTNVLWSLALFVLLFFFWYCHKRGREVRLEKEKTAAEATTTEGRVEELQDDPMLEAAPAVPAESAPAAQIPAVPRSENIPASTTTINPTL
ncbi:MAG: hypothetical protein M1814_001518 [Vezdaea aestivalis]|nr:MAG: hypothetical protein M1814_001518 [Vezdaea aestivalis]